MRIRLAATLVALTLAVAACGSRVDDEVTQVGDGQAASEGGSQTTGGGGNGGAAPAASESPCGPGDASGATDVGVTDDTITIATIQDIDVPGVQGLFQQNLQAMQAFVAYCNDLGGILGRRLELNDFDSKLTDHAAAVQQACDGSFAIVGQGAVFDDAGIPAARECGIPIVPGFTGSPAAGGATDIMVQPIPNPPGSWAVGPGRYVLEQVPDATKHAVMFKAPSAAEDRANQQVDAYEQIGFDFIIDERIGIGDLQSDWAPRVEAYRNAGGGYLYVQAEDVDLANFLLEAEAQGVDVEWADAGQQVYTRGFLKAAGSAADGVHVYATTVPFEEADTSEQIMLYLDYLERTNPGADPDALGVQTWSSGLLFATAAKELGSDLTRAGLLDTLHGITEWDGLGSHVPADPGENIGTNCFMYLTVEDGEFVREFPDEGFECADDNTVETHTG